MSTKTAINFSAICIAIVIFVVLVIKAADKPVEQSSKIHDKCKAVDMWIVGYKNRPTPMRVYDCGEVER